MKKNNRTKSRVLLRTSSMEALGERLEKIAQELSDTLVQVQHLIQELNHLWEQTNQSGRREILSGVTDLIGRLSLETTQEGLLRSYFNEAGQWVQKGLLFINQDSEIIVWDGFGFTESEMDKVRSGSAGPRIEQTAAGTTLSYLEEDGEDFVGLFPWLSHLEVQPVAAVCIPFVFGKTVPLIFYGDSSEPFPVSGLELATHIIVLTLKNHSLERELAIKSVGKVSGAESDQSDYDDMEHPHSEALRLARLLVSEILLYHRDQVEAGCRDGNLYLRLQNLLDQSQNAYERRVHPVVAAQHDYLHEEVVRLLAGGDATLLGKDYPGPALQTIADDLPEESIEVSNQ